MLAVATNKLTKTLSSTALFLYYSTARTCHFMHVHWLQATKATKWCHVPVDSCTYDFQSWIYLTSIPSLVGDTYNWHLWSNLYGHVSVHVSVLGVSTYIHDGMHKSLRYTYYKWMTYMYMCAHTYIQVLFRILAMLTTHAFKQWHISPLISSCQYSTFLCLSASQTIRITRPQPCEVKPKDDRD